jgi:hypothetical protein
MEGITFSLLDMIHLFLMLGACYACNRWGYHQGIHDAVQFFESQGMIELDKDDVKVKPKTKE